MRLAPRPTAAPGRSGDAGASGAPPGKLRASRRAGLSGGAREGILRYARRPLAGGADRFRPEAARPRRSAIQAADQPDDATGPRAGACASPCAAPGAGPCADPGAGRRGPAHPARAAGGAAACTAARAPAATRAFQIAHQAALLFHADLIEATLDLAGFRTAEAREIARIGLANYFAGAALLPYRVFIEAANAERHDLEALADRFGASLEQVGHRLSTLQRPGAKGVPFFFARVDQAGTVTKRHSATRLQFARYGGACPLWNVHQAFETPGRLLRQLAETPDGTRYICLAADVSKPGGGFRRPVRRYAIALGCETRHAERLVYADDLDLSRDAVYEPIGVSCRICERRQCHQRSVPPLRAEIRVDRDRRDVLPYSLYDQGAMEPGSR